MPEATATPFNKPHRSRAFVQCSATGNPPRTAIDDSAKLPGALP